MVAKSKIADTCEECDGLKDVSINRSVLSSQKQQSTRAAHRLVDMHVQTGVPGTCFLRCVSKRGFPALASTMRYQRRNIFVAVLAKVGTHSTVLWRSSFGT